MKKEKTTKKKYTIWQNSLYMIKLAWDNAKSVLVLCGLLIIIGILLNVTKLLVVPVILSNIEKKVALTVLIKYILGFTGVLLILSMGKRYIECNIMSGRIDLRSIISNELHQKLCKTSYPHIEDENFQKTVSKAFDIANGNQSATEHIWDSFEQLLINVICFVIYLFLLYRLPPVILLVIIISSVIGFFITNYTNSWDYRHREEEAELIKKMDYIVDRAGEPAIGKDIRIFGMKNWLEEIYAKNLHLYQDFLDKQSRFYLVGDIIDILFSILRNGVAYYYLISLVIKNGLPTSEFLLYFSAVSGFSTWVSGILENMHELHNESLDLNIGREFLEYPEIFRFESGIPIPQSQDGTYTIELQNVSFRYPSAEEDTIHHLNLKISAGEKIAIVGLNGAGKTTLVKLICGFYDPTEGEILLNSVNIKNFNRQEYYQLFSAVFQQFSILASTIEDNIAQSVAQADSGKIADAIDLAGLTEKMNELPEHEKTHLTKEVYLDGIELSGGQTQRLMLARALYRNAPILVLDEPTAALDPIAENDIYLKYNDMTSGRTSIFISHRLASTRFCDRILFLQNGNILEEGTHEELLKQGGAYSDLFEVQSRYYQEDASEEEL